MDNAAIGAPGLVMLWWCLVEFGIDSGYMALKFLAYECSWAIRWHESLRGKYTVYIASNNNDMNMQFYLLFLFSA